MRALFVVIICLIIYYAIASSATITAFPLWAANDPRGAMEAIQNVFHALYGGVGPFAQRLLTGAVCFIAGYGFARVVDFCKYVFRSRPAHAQ